MISLAQGIGVIFDAPLGGTVAGVRKKPAAAYHVPCCLRIP